MPQSSRRSLLIVLAIVWILSFYFINQTLRPNEKETAAATPTAVPTVDMTESQTTEESGVRLAVQTNNAGEPVAVGKRIEYTIAIRNDRSQAIEPSLTNTPVDDLVIDAGTQTASSGEVTLTREGDTRVLNWSGTVEPGEEVILTYTAHPNYFSEPDQTLNNTIRLTVEDKVLEISAPITNQRGFGTTFIVYMARGLEWIASGLEKIGLSSGVAIGLAIIFFTVVVRAATFPLNKKQIESTKATQDLQPKLKELQKKYANDREALAREQMALYKEYGINPLGGCLPMLVQMPIWLALYRALFHMASDSHFLDGSFFWIPSLAGPVQITSGFRGGVDWVFPWSVNFLGWGDALAYLVLPVLLVVSQLFMQRMMTPKSDDQQQKMMGQMMMFMPFMFGYFSLVVPSGLTLYWFTSNLLGIAQQYYMTRERKDLEDGSREKAVSKPLAAQNALEVSPAAAVAAENPSDTKKQVETNATKRRKRKKRRKK